MVLTASPKAGPEAASECRLARSATRLVHANESALRLVDSLRTRINRARLAYDGPKPEKADPVPPSVPLDQCGINELEQRLANLLDEANAAAQLLGDFLP